MYQEGKAQFEIGVAFFRSATQVVRDLGVLAAAIYRQTQGKLRVLDGMAGCGVRSLRYALESDANWVWTNEGNPELEPLLRQNLQGNSQTVPGQLTFENVQRLLHRCAANRDYFDLVDLDCFGDSMPYLSLGLGATRIGGLLYLTSTDGRSLTGHLPLNSLRSYGVVARSHPAAQEQALRILLGALQQQAASMGLGMEPVLSLFTGQTYRVMVRLVHKTQLQTHNYGFLGYCHRCGEYQTVDWLKLGRVNCEKCDRPATITGPMWLGPLHDRFYLAAMQTLAQAWQWSKRVDLLTTLQAEATLPPYFYRLGEIGKRGKLHGLPSREALISALIAQGFSATTPHVDSQAVKTTACLGDCVAIARRLQP
ncbi:MAG: tRNA (guanine-N1)-methyltransferase [Spirulina sp. SIO3F2]|nr:tRNA (guanine-N1)-methyltransferase [Spirulina sp. SIO3F2]